MKTNKHNTKGYLLFIIPSFLLNLKIIISFATIKQYKYININKYNNVYDRK